MHESVRSRSASAGCVRRDVDRAQRLRQRWQRLHRRRHDQGLSVRHAALETAGVVGLAVEAAPLVVEDLVVGLRAGLPASAKPSPSPTPFTAWIEQRACARRPSSRSSHETCEPRPTTAPYARTSTHRRATRSPGAGRRCAQPSRASSPRPDSGPARRRRRRRPRARAARRTRARRSSRSDVTCETTSTPSSRQERLAERPARDARRGLACAGAFEHVAHVGETVFHDAGEVRMTGPGQMDLLDRRVDRPRIHPLLPIREVPVRDAQRDRAADRRAVPDPRRRLRGVALDLHAPAAPVSELAARHLTVDRVPIDHAGRPGDPRSHRSARDRATPRP